MKFRHQVRFTWSRYLKVDYDVYRMSTCIHFSHLSFTTEMDSSLVLNFAFPYHLVLGRAFQRQLDSGTSFEDRGWSPDVCYQAATRRLACRIVRLSKGWEKAGVKEIANSDKPLPPVDPFEKIYQAWSVLLECEWLGTRKKEHWLCMTM